jgi:glycosyltransferase involved in cell wall biosynthesis
MSRILQVLHVVPAVAARYGGPSGAAIGMCRAIQGESISIATTLATTDADGGDRLPVPIGRMGEYEGIRSIFFERIGPESFKWSPGLSRWLAANVGAFDLVHIHGVLSHASLAAARACRRQGVPYLMRPLGTLDPWSLRRHAIRKTVLLAASGRRAIMGAAALHYTSEQEQEGAEAAFPGLPPGAIVPLGIDDDLFDNRREPEAKDVPYVLSLSRIDPKKGIDLLIQAFHEAGPRLPEWRLVVAGDGAPNYLASLRDLAQSGPAASQITFCGWVDGEARRTWLRGATLFALPSHQENFGIAVVQAMAAGVPSVVSPGVALAREIEAAQVGWVVGRESLAAGLAAILADRSACEDRGRLARQYAERYRWSRVGHLLAEVYRRVADRQSVPRSVTAGAPEVGVQAGVPR